jgi:hypothetical protein
MEDKIIKNSDLALGDFIENFKTLLTTIQYNNNRNNDKQYNNRNGNNDNNKIKKNLFQKMYQKAFSEIYAEDVCILLLNNKKVWIPLFNHLKSNITLIPDSFTNTYDTIFNKFTRLYNQICELLKVYFTSIENIEINNNVPIDFRFLYSDKSKYHIENIYSLIELTDRTLNQKHTLKSYYNSMLRLQKTKKKVIKNNIENKYVPKEINRESSKSTKNESKYNFALNESKTLLIKVRKSQKLLFKDEQLNIGLLYYNLRRIVQVLVILKNTIKYYYASKKYIVNKNLRTNLLTLIQTLQGTISRTNKLENEGKERNRLAIRSAFKRRLLNSSLNGNDFVHNSLSNMNKSLGVDFRKKITTTLEFKNIP